MENFKKYFGFIGLFIFLIFTAIAVLNYSNYNFTGQYLSELGIGPASAIWFNTGLILTGLILAIYFLFNFKSTEKITGTLSGLSLMGVGIFPMNIEPAHTLTAALFFALAGITALTYSIQNQKHSPRVRLFGFSFVLMDLIFLILNKNPVLQKITVVTFGIWIIVISLQKN